jgi:O-antigen/teichoic acid export membrane protein
MVVFVIVYLVVILVLIFVPSLEFIGTDFPGLDAIIAWAAAAFFTFIVYAVMALRTRYKMKHGEMEPYSMCTTTALWAALTMGTVVTGFGQYIYERHIKAIAPV